MSAHITDQDPWIEQAYEMPEQFAAHELLAGDYYEYSTSNSLYDPADVKQIMGFSARVPLEIAVGDTRLMVVDLRDHPKSKEGYRQVPGFAEVSTDFLLINPEVFKRTNTQSGFKGLRIEEPIIVGREGNKTTTERLELEKDDAISRRHFSISIRGDNSVILSDLNSTNGTEVTSVSHTASSNRTINAVDRLRQSGEYELADEIAPYGYFRGKPILGRQSPKIEGGVYVGGSSREAIVVDEKDPALQQVYEDAKRVVGGLRLAGRILSKGKGDTPETRVMESVLKTVQHYLKYDGEKTNEISNQYRGDKLVSLGEYVREGVGVCRHQGLLAGYIVERLIHDGRLHGTVRVERNTIPEYGGTHAWATYKPEDGNEIVIDPAQSFVGTKKAARHQTSRWDYYLPIQ